MLRGERKGAPLSLIYQILIKVEGGKLIFKYTYFLVKLNREIVYADGAHRLSGFQFYFSKEDTAKFEQIANILF